MLNDQSAAVHAFDTIAERFDSRFGHLLSVTAQRNAVRRSLLDWFPAGSRLLELGGGTGEDAIYLAERGRRVVMTDGSRSMVRVAAEKVRSHGLEHMVSTVPILLEDLSSLPGVVARAPFDGAYSNFAALNCVEDVATVARDLAGVLPLGAMALLVVFGPYPLGEVVVQLGRGRPAQAFRRFGSRGPIDARLNGHHFPVWYPRPQQIARAFRPYFRLRQRRGIGVSIPPSDAEPAISRFPRLVRTLETADRFLSRPFAIFGDHILLAFERTAAPAAALTPGDGTST